MKYIITSLGAILLVASGYVLQQGETELTEVPPYELVGLGSQYIAVMEKNDTKELVYVPLTAQEYEQCCGHNAPSQNQPTMTGYTWKYSTSNPVEVKKQERRTLKDGEYAIENQAVGTGTPTFRVKKAGEAELITSTLEEI